MTQSTIDPTESASREAARYNAPNVLLSEAMYGEDAQSPGGYAQIAECCRTLALRPGSDILDIGSGLGGSAFYLAKRYDARVVGVDASPDMVRLARERQASKRVKSVEFIHGDICAMKLPTKAFDLVWSRDVFVCIKDKAALWGRVLAALRPGGQVLLTDFCLGNTPPSPSFAAYAERCDYHLQTQSEYTSLLLDFGFTGIQVEDISSSLERWLTLELESFTGREADIVERFGRANFEYMIRRWEKKRAFCTSADLKWMRITARLA